jgi:hypothetical protein
MVKTTYFISKIPLPLTSVSLGRFITVPNNPPQNFFDPHEELSTKPQPLSDKSDILNPSDFIEKSYGTSLELILTSFASVFFKVQSSSAHQLGACRMTRYFILNVDKWFDTICGDSATQFWLERQTMRKKKIYLVTEFSTLVQTSSSVDKTLTFSVGGSAQAPLAAAIGAPLPTPLDPSISIGADKSDTRRVSYEIPGEKVVSIGYQQVKLSKNAEGKHEYTLDEKRKWIETCGVRAANVDAMEITAELAEVSIPQDCEAVETEDAVYFFDKVTIKE